MQLHTQSAEHVEFDEAEIFSDESAAGEELDNSSQHDDEPLFATDDVVSGAVDVGPGSGSAKSITLQVVVEETEAMDEVDEYPMVGSRRPARVLQPALAQSMPVHGATIKMGSSVPINIPFMQRQVTAPKNLPGPMAAPATFVPPHQLSQRDDYMALMGESPAAAMKRDRLRMRNNILKSTGFLENPSLLPGMVAGVGIVGGGELAPSLTPVRAGGLAQALQRPNPAMT